MAEQAKSATQNATDTAKDAAEKAVDKVQDVASDAMDSAKSDDAGRSRGFDLRIAEPIARASHRKKSASASEEVGTFFYCKREWRPRRNSGVVNLFRVAESELAGTVLDRHLAAQAAWLPACSATLSARNRLLQRLIFGGRSLWRIRLGCRSDRRPAGFHGSGKLRATLR